MVTCPRGEPTTCANAAGAAVTSAELWQTQRTRSCVLRSQQQLLAAVNNGNYSYRALLPEELKVGYRCCPIDSRTMSVAEPRSALSSFYRWRTSLRKAEGVCSQEQVMGQRPRSLGYAMLITARSVLLSEDVNCRVDPKGKIVSR